jgi:hypothetical protein
MNRTTSRHLASSIATDRWAAADKSRTPQRSDDDETRNDHGHPALTAWAARVQRGVSLLSRRTAADTALD